MTSTTSTNPPAGGPGAKKITRDDIEAKFAQLQGGAAAEADQRKSSALTIGIVAVFVALLVAYFLGRRRGRKRRTVVEVHRI
jgi:hypothetical protein